MNSEKGLYWIAAGVLALGVGNSLINKKVEWIACRADRISAVVERVSDRAAESADRALAMADAAFGRGESRVARTQAKLACAQARLSRAQAVLDEHRELMAGLANESIQVSEARALPRVVVVPQPNVRVEIHRMPSLPGEGSI